MSTWGKIHGSITWHAKALAAGDAALGVWVRLLGHCAQHLTDGFIPTPVALAVGSTSPGAVDALVSAGLLEVAQGGYRLHDYLEHNSSRADIEASREASRERMAKTRAARKPHSNSGCTATTPATNGATPTATFAATQRATFAERSFAGEREIEREEEQKSARDAQPSLALDPTTGADAPASASAGGVIAKVFDHWRAVHKHPGAKLDANRRKVIQQAIKSHGLEVTLAAIDGCANSPYHQGQNDRGQVYDDLSLILRNAAKIEGFARLAVAAPASASSGSSAQTTSVASSGAFGRPVAPPREVVRSVETRTPEQIQEDARRQARAARDALARAQSRTDNDGGEDDE